MGWLTKNIRTNDITGDKVFISRERAEDEIYYCNENESSYEIGSVKLPFVGKYVSMVNAYFGFDYGMVSMFDICHRSRFYPSVEKAKSDKLWIESEQRSIAKPDEFNKHPLRICSKDIFGTDWIYGDFMEGNSCTDIVKYRVVR